MGPLIELSAILGTIGLVVWTFDKIDKNTKLFGRLSTDAKGGIGLVAVLVALFTVALAGHDLIIRPCRAADTVTNSLGTYNSEWCLWVRGAFSDAFAPPP